MATKSDAVVGGPGHRARRARHLVVLPLVAVAASAALTACQPILPATETRLANGATLASGQSLVSPSGGFRMVMQTDGNLVERSAAGVALWTSKTTSNPGAKLVMGTDGVLRVRTVAGGTVWSTPTYGVSGATVGMGDDANFVVRGTAGQPQWANGVSAASSTRAPASQLHTSSQQVTLTKMYEGFEATPYTSGGACYVGYGHLLHAGACTPADAAQTYDPDAMFAADVPVYENRLKASLGTVPMSQHEFDALWDFTYGRGSLTAATAPQTYAAMTATPPNYTAVPSIWRTTAQTSATGVCDRLDDQATVFSGGNYQRTSSC